MNSLEKFSEDFDELIEVTYNTYWDLPVIHKKSFSKSLEEIILDIPITNRNSFNLTLNDLRQELSSFWLKYEKQYKNPKENVALRSYLIRRSIWDIRDWLKRQTNIVVTDPFLGVKNDCVAEFKLDLLFLFEGTNYPPLRILSPYERYIIFLKFKEEKSILQMSKILQKDRRVVKSHFDSIIKKLKKVSNHGK